jgi:hypothetical protein
MSAISDSPAGGVQVVACAPSGTPAAIRSSSELAAGGVMPGVATRVTSSAASWANVGSSAEALEIEAMMTVPSAPEVWENVHVAGSDPSAMSQYSLICSWSSPGL